MIKHSSNDPLVAEIREEFSRRYPFLKVEFSLSRQSGLEFSGLDAGPDRKDRLDAARHILENEMAVSDSMTVRDLEQTMEEYFSAPVQVSRKSGKFWIETRMTRNWTLRQQNELGRDLSSPQNKPD